MAQPYVGEIRMFAGSFNPLGWEFCNGQLMPISENETLFQVIGTTYGGDGQETFALPNLQSRVPLHQSGNYIIGQTGGVESVTLTTQQIPVHSHTMLVTTEPGLVNSPAAAVLASSPTVSIFRPGVGLSQMAAGSMNPAGGSQPHENMQPFLVISFIISLFGLFPSQT